MATKVVHLGDQLEATNSRRDRAVEAQELIRYLAEFEENPKPNLPIFNDSSMVCTYICTYTYMYIFMAYDNN